MTEIKEISKDNSDNGDTKIANEYDDDDDDDDETPLDTSFKCIAILFVTLAAATLTLIPKILCMFEMDEQVPGHLHPEHPLMACLESVSIASLGASLVYFSKPLFLML